MRLGSYLVDRRPLAIPEFRRLWTASVVTAVGGSFSHLAVPTQLFALTGSSATVGLSATVSLAALTVSALCGGALADRVDRRRLLLGGHGLLGLAYVGLWLQALLRLGSVPTILALGLVQSVALGATLTTMGAAVPRFVPVSLLAPANGLSSVARYTGAVLGPLLAGALIPFVGLRTLYLLDALALLAVLWAVARLPAMPPLTRSARAGVGAGARYLMRERILLAVLGVDLAAMVFSMPVALYPELAARTYGTGSVGLLFAAYPAGVLTAGLVSGAVTGVRRHGAAMATAAVLWGLCVVLLATASRLWLALVALMLGGAVNFGLSVFRNAITQAHTDDELRGRIQGILVVVLMGGPQLANVAHGLASALIGPQWTIAAGGALTVATVVVIVRAAPALWRYTPHDQEVHGVDDGSRLGGGRLAQPGQAGLELLVGDQDERGVGAPVERVRRRL